MPGVALVWGSPASRHAGETKLADDWLQSLTLEHASGAREKTRAALLQRAFLAALAEENVSGSGLSAAARSTSREPALALRFSDVANTS